MVPFRQLSWPFLAVVILGVVLVTMPARSALQKEAEGWVQLFNGKDFTGWKIPSPPSGSV